MKYGHLLALPILAAAALAANSARATTTTPAPLARLPLCFEANCGQAAPTAQFLARSRSGTVLLSPGEATVSLVTSDAAGAPARIGVTHSHRQVESRGVSFQFLGANRQAAMTGVDLLPARANYLIGKDPAAWRSDVFLFAKVRVAGVYPGIDLVYYGNQQKLEYDLVVAPGANPDAIRLRIAGADKVELSPEGELVLWLGQARLRQHKPIVHQTIDGATTEVCGAYRMIDAQTVGFEVGPYNPQAPLVIDPVLSYASYFGGAGWDAAFGTAVDGAGNVYVAGQTLSVGLTNTPTAFQTNYQGGWFGDAFVAKFSNAGSNLLYMTYLGGTGDDAALSIAVDAAGNACLTGATDSTNFPTAGAFRSGPTGIPSMIFGLLPFDAFVAKLNATGSALVYSTCLGGDGYDEGVGIALDAAGSAYITGFTTSTNFTTYRPLPGQSTLPGLTNAFVTKLTPSGSGMVYSTYLGGTNWDQGSGIAVDAAGRAFVTGVTSSTNFPTVNPVQRWLAGGFDVFVSVLAADGQSLQTSTYLGGAAYDDGFRIALDAGENAYVVGTEGSTWTTNAGMFPITPGNLNPGGVFVSSDSGATWNASNSGLQRPEVLSIAIDPANRNRVYAGTGRGAARSLNFGASWDTSVLAAPDSYGIAPQIAVGAITTVAVDPQTPTRAYAGTTTGVYRTLDAGLSWSLMTTGYALYYPLTTVFSLAVDPANPANVYAGTLGYGVFSSTNSATSWTYASYGFGSLNIFSLAIDPANPATLYAGTDTGVYRSDNAGALWNISNAGLTNYYVYALAIDPQAPATLYAGTAEGLFKSTDRGTNWTGLPIGAGLTNSIRVQALVIDPFAPGTLYAGTTNGLIKSTDAGASWASLNTGLPVSNIRSLAIDPGNSARVYAGAGNIAGTETGDAFLVKLTNSAQAIQFSTVLGGTGTNAGWALAVDAAGNSYIAGNTTATNFPTRDAFGSLTATNHGNNDVFVAAINPDASRLLYSGYFGGSGEDFGFSVALDPVGSVWVVGQTASTDFPTNNALQTTLGGGTGTDAFVAKVSPASLAGLVATLTGPNLVLKWQAPAGLFTLQTAARLPAAAADWSAVSQTPATSNSWQIVTLPASGSGNVFRLHRP